MGDLNSRRNRLDYEPALQTFREGNVFTESEMERFTNKVRLIEINLADAAVCLDDYKAAIKYEEGIFVELRRRRKLYNIQNIDYLEWLFMKRIKAVYLRGLNRFPGDYEFNMGLFEFLKLYEEPQLLVMKEHVANMMARFVGDPEVFRKLAKWYFMWNQFEEARRILLEGQFHHPKALGIYLDLIEIEFRNDRQPGFPTRLKDVVYKIIQADITHRFLQEVIRCFGGHVLLLEVADYAIEQLLLTFRDEPAVWKFVALRELNGDYYPSTDKKIIEDKYSVERAIQRFRDGISIVPEDKKPTLYISYLDMVEKLQKDKPNAHSLQVLREALDEAERANVDIKESHYVAWVSCCQKSNTTVLVKKLDEGTKSYPQSLLLWSLYLKHYIEQDNLEFSRKVFENAVDNLGAKSIKVFEAFIDFIMLRSRADEIDKVFEKAINHPSKEVAKVFKKRYLHWTMMSRSIEAGRRLYPKIATKDPFCEKLHLDMFIADKLEDIQVLATPFQEKVLKLWKEQFGTEDIQVFIQKIEYTKAYGGRDANQKVAAIYRDAMATLSNDKLKAQFKATFADMNDLEHTMTR